MKQRAKRIADFIESVPGAQIDSSSVILGGDSQSPMTAKNGGACINTDSESCKKSTNGGDCKNQQLMCTGSSNTGSCNNDYQSAKNQYVGCAG